MKMSGDSSPSQRSTSQSPGGQRKKYYHGSQTRGRDKTRTHPTHGGGETPGNGRSPSNSRLCWNCDEVVTGDHYASTCTRPKKTEDHTRPITPYPGRERSSSKDRGGPSQGGETYRMMQGSFGRKPWTSGGSAATSPAAGTVGDQAEQAELRPGPAAALVTRGRGRAI